jgi:hypothetical protein
VFPWAIVSKIIQVIAVRSLITAVSPLMNLVLLHLSLMEQGIAIGVSDLVTFP